MTNPLTLNTLTAAPSGKPKWRPRTRAQWALLNSSAKLALFGGAAGSLKTASIVADAVQEVSSPDLHAIIIRRTFPQLRDVIKKCYELYPRLGGKYQSTEKVWTFPSGATVELGYINGDDDVYQYDGREFSAIYFDESTQHTEFQIRYMFSRLRSTNRSLFLRMRLATNPGHEGHAWHMHVFLGKHCPHCNPNAPDVRKPFVIYQDATWSDGTPLGCSTQFIPGYVRDHDLLGEDYIKNLQMQRPAEAKALLEGCWALFVGQFFRCWEPNRQGQEGGPDMRMVIPRAEAPDIYWYQYFIGEDYGYGVSQAASYLCIKTPALPEFPNGRIYVLDEHNAPEVEIKPYTEGLVEKFILAPTPEQKRRSIAAMFLGPDCWAQDGSGGHSLADQANEVLGEHNLGFVMANNDRAGGWQHIYNMLKSGELVICDSCEQLIAAIPSRVYDDKKSSDIKKVKGDPLDDAVDALRYAIYSFITEPVKPKEIRIHEAMQPHILAGDATNAMIARQVALKKIEEESRLPVLGGNPRRHLQDLARRRRS